MWWLFKTDLENTFSSFPPNFPNPGYYANSLQIDVLVSSFSPLTPSPWREPGWCFLDQSWLLVSCSNSWWPPFVSGYKVRIPRVAHEALYGWTSFYFPALTCESSHYVLTIGHHWPCGFLEGVRSFRPQDICTALSSWECSGLTLHLVKSLPFEIKYFL